MDPNRPEPTLINLNYANIRFWRGDSDPSFLLIIDQCYQLADMSKSFAIRLIGKLSIITLKMISKFLPKKKMNNHFKTVKPRCWLPLVNRRSKKASSKCVTCSNLSDNVRTVSTKSGQQFINSREKNVLISFVARCEDDVSRVESTVKKAYGSDQQNEIAAMQSKAERQMTPIDKTTRPVWIDSEGPFAFVCLPIPHSHL